jgi:hypothetical protein
MRPGEAEDAEGERALSPQEMLDIIEAQRATAERHFSGILPMYYITWGLAVLAGYGAFFLRYGVSGRPDGPISIGAALTILFGSMAVGVAVTSYMGWKQSSQVRGASRDRGTMYGLSWFFGYMMVGIIGNHFGRQLPEAERTLLWSCLSIMVLSVLFMAGAAMFNLRPMFYFGVWTTVVNLAGVVAGPGWHALFVALGVGGVFVAIGVALHLRMRLRPAKA